MKLERNELMVLLMCAAIEDDTTDTRFKDDDHEDELNELKRYEMINDRNEILDRGQVHIDALLDVSIPEQKWISPLRG